MEKNHSNENATPQDVENLQDIENLLKKTTQIQDKYILTEQLLAPEFNILTILHTASKEVDVCRLLYEVLNPQGSHGHGNTYLKLFVQDVLQINTMTDDEWENISVCREHYIPDSGRRIDLVIQTQKRFIPIEVKIYAADQKSQCFDYYQYANNIDKQAELYYLTLDGHLPSEDSYTSSDESKSLTQSSSDKIDGITCISFETDVLMWLRNCLSLNETLRYESLRIFFMQFIKALESLTQQSIGEKDLEIIDLLSQSKESIKAARDISKNFDATRTQMMRKIFTALAEKIKTESGETREEAMLTDFAQNNEKSINDYYKRQASTFPSINYFCKKLYDDVDLYFRIEMEDTLFCGFCTPKDKKNQNQLVDKQQLENYFGKNTQFEFDGWWIQGIDLPNKSAENNANFKIHNDPYFALYDDDAFENFIEKCYQKMKEFTDDFAKETGFSLK